MAEYITLEEMMGFRERKVKKQEELRRQCEGGSVVTLGMNIPGPVKTSPEILYAFQVGAEALDQYLNRAGIRVEKAETVLERAGYVRFYGLSEMDTKKIKRIAVELEEEHPLGRLFDIDVYDWNGNGISRHELGLVGRTCLLCGNDAKLCGRSRAHTVEELYTRILGMIEIFTVSQER